MASNFSYNVCFVSKSSRTLRGTERERSLMRMAGSKAATIHGAEYISNSVNFPQSVEIMTRSGKHV